MCLAIPLKILEIKEGRAIVGSKNHKHEADLSLIKDARVGDYVLVHSGLAINKVEEEEARRILKMTKNLNHEYE